MVPLEDYPSFIISDSKEFVFLDFPYPNILATLSDDLLSTFFLAGFGFSFSPEKALEKFPPHIDALINLYGAPIEILFQQKEKEQEEEEGEATSSAIPPVTLPVPFTPEHQLDIPLLTRYLSNLPEEQELFLILSWEKITLSIFFIPYPEGIISFSSTLIYTNK